MSENSEEFWNTATQNLEAMKIKIIIAADVIPKELRQVIEFVNRNADFELLALEVKLFAEKDGKQALVPYIIGATEKATLSAGERDNWTFEKLQERIYDSENEIRRKHFLELMQYCRNLNAFNMGISKNPSFRFHNKDGQNVMTFCNDGRVFMGLLPDIYGGEACLKQFFEQINRLRIFGYEESDCGHWKLSKGKIEKLNDNEFTELKILSRRLTRNHGEG